MNSLDKRIAQVCRDTPDIQVLDNRSLTIRELQLHRATPDEVIDARPTCHTYNKAGHLIASIDPRLATLREQNPEVSPNFTYLTSLSGHPLLTQSVDAGWQVQLHDIAERPLYQANQAGTVRTFAYDDLDRPVAIYESKLDSIEQPRVTERMVYGDALPDAEAQLHNLKGQLLRHYDLGGLRALTSFNLLGFPLTESRRLLAVENIESDWQGDAESDWQRLLLPGEDNAYITQWTYSALAETLTQTDAMGNKQRYSYLSTGQLKGLYLTQKGQAERVITHELEYNAAGLKLKETAGNGVSTEYTYDADSLRLSRVRVTRPTQSGRHSVLQDLRYRHDPVGNVLSIEDASAATRFYKNQRVSANNQYRYDSLYQLTQATGRENDHILPQSSGLPAPLIPTLADTQQLRNYTRTYRYDRGGNLLRITHRPASGHGYTREMVVSNRSNRAIAQVAGAPLRPEDVEEYFDKVGNLKALATGQPLSWDGQSQLRDATLVTRETSSDIERYRYSTQGVRLSKTTETVSDVASQRVKRETVIYLPGLELRQRWERKVSRSFFRSATLTEDLHVLVIGQGNSGTARVLHWAKGKPASLENDALRYSVDTHLGSSALELNQEADILTQEEYYPFGGTAVWSAKSQTEAKYKTIRYSGKERDATGLYYYGYRYYAPWLCRWLNPDPAGTVDGVNLFRMVRNNPVTLQDADGRMLSRKVGWSSAHIPHGLDGPLSLGANPLSRPIPSSIGSRQYGKDSPLSRAKSTPDMNPDGTWFGHRGTLSGQDDEFIRHVNDGGNPETFENSLATGFSYGYSDTSKKQSKLYRGDSRPPEEIFKNGFIALGGNADPTAHLSFRGDSAFIATTKVKSQAATYSFGRSDQRIETGYLYKIKGLGMETKTFDVEARYPNEPAVKRNQEVLVLQQVAPQHIAGAYKVRGNRFTPSVGRRFIKNPNFEASK
nr:RHS repeat-associated core domain-containing protein [Vibrio parahaemolyticus]